MAGSIYNVMGAEILIQAMLAEFPTLHIEDRFSKTDWNVELPDDPAYEDRFKEWCEEVGLTCKLV